MMKEFEFGQIWFCSKLFLLAIASGLVFSCFPGTSNNGNSDLLAEPVSIPKPGIDLADPLDISTRPKDVAWCEQTKNEISASDFARANWGIIALSLTDGRIICGIDGQKLFNPASTQKILTSIVAFDKLGPNFKWSTSLYAKREVEDGVLSGDLTLYGSGAPDFDSVVINELVTKLKAKGLRSITGDIVGDDSFFKGDALGDGWAWNEIQWYYGAPASALSVNKNQAKITLQNQKPKSSTGFVEVSGKTGPIEDIEAVGLKRDLGQNKVYVWGYGNDLNARIAVENPALWAAAILKKALEKNGIKVEGRERSVDWRSEGKLDTGSAKEIASAQSQPLSEIVRRMNKDSVNLYAELILRTLGKQFGETAPDQNPKMQKLRGDDSAGAAVIKKWLSENNIAAAEIEIHDGSGLSRLDFVTPETILRALVFGVQSKFADEFKNSLPIAGVDGTLRGRLGNVSGKIIAKTGSIQYVNTLAGYAESADETFAFVIICNNATGKSDSGAVIDAIASSLIN